MDNMFPAIDIQSGQIRLAKWIYLEYVQLDWASLAHG